MIPGSLKQSGGGPPQEPKNRCWGQSYYQTQKRLELSSLF